jgi:alkylated DNA repair dioxygenase AlkB
VIAPAPLFRMDEIQEYLAAAQRTYDNHELTEGEKRAQLRYILRRISPMRQKVDVIPSESQAYADSSAPVTQSTALAPESIRFPGKGKQPPSKVPMAAATASELLEAIREDAQRGIGRLKGPDCAYKEVELRFKHITSSPCRTVADAIANGALSFLPDANWRSDHALKLSLGIVELLPPSASDPPTRADTCMAAGGIYTLLARPGFYILPAALSPAQQRYWIRRVLRSYVEPPQRRNIDADKDVDYSNLVAATMGIDSARVVRLPDGRFVPYSALHDPSLAAEVLDKVASHADTTAFSASTKDFETNLWQRHVAASDESVLSRVSWATVGYQYDWTARQYHLPTDPDYHLHASSASAAGLESSRWHAAFPSDLWRWSTSVAEVCNSHAMSHFCRDDSTDYPSLEALGLPMTIDAQSGICNLYNASKKLPMGAHVDDMERDFRFPVVSLSLGCTGGHETGCDRNCAPSKQFRSLQEFTCWEELPKMNVQFL